MGLSGPVEGDPSQGSVPVTLDMAALVSRAGDPRHELAEHRPPSGRIYAVARDYRTIFRSPHNPR